MRGITHWEIIPVDTYIDDCLLDKFGIVYHVYNAKDDQMSIFLK